VARRRYFSDYGRASGGREPRPQVVPYLLIAVLAIVGLLLMQGNKVPAPTVTITGRVLDQYTGQPLIGASVTLLAAGPDRPAPPLDSAGVAIVDSHPITVAGVSTDTGAAAPPIAVLTTTTGADGVFSLTNPPAGAGLLIAQAGYAPQQISTVGRSGLIDVRLQPDTLHGTVTGPDGRPVAGATLVVGPQLTATAADGTYTLSGIGADHKLLVKAPGYKVVRQDFGNTTRQDLTLVPFTARAIYVSGDTLAAPGKFYSLIKLANDTEINAMVVDVKADTTGYVLYKSALPQVQAAGAIDPVIPDLHELIATLHKNNIYVIARQALFWDEKLVAAHPEWAIHSKTTGGPWQDAYGHHWVNPYRTEVWDYNIAIAKEVGSLGADEIQFDYVRFPSDGNLRDTDYGVPDSQPKADAIAGYLAQAQAELSKQGVFVAADVFGLSPIVQDDLGIGQEFDKIVAHVDYASPMAYPSHYAAGFLGYDKPAEHPSEIVGYTLKAAQAKMLSSNGRLRPWLQDFTLGGVAYDVTRVRGQIDTAESNGTAGWMLWNYENVYTQAALKKSP